MFPFGTSLPSKWRRSGDELRDRLEWTAAARNYRRYLARYPKDGAIWVQLGNCLKEAKHFAEADKAYRRAFALMPSDADLRIQMGHLAKLRGRAQEAVEEYWEGYTLAAERTDARDEAFNVLDDLEHRGGLMPSVGAAPRTAPDALIHPGRDRFLNARQAALEPRKISRSADAIASLRKRLSGFTAVESSTKIPKIVHFVYGFKHSGDIPYYGYMAIKSALHFNPGWRVLYFTMNEPYGPNWSKIASRVNIIKLDDFDYFGNAYLNHYAHKSDVVRLIALNLIGGVYLDIDTITRRPFEPLLDHDFVMGVQAASPNSSSGLCNAIMMGKPSAHFSTEWLSHYDYFRSRGRDDLWDYHSVKLPVLLMCKYPGSIHVLDYRKLFYPLWHSIQRSLFSENSFQYEADFEPAICHHLWNGATSSWLDGIDESFVRSSKSIYAQIARDVEGLPRLSGA
jgi:tetratricopeptide (TPR) repeat protein